MTCRYPHTTISRGISKNRSQVTSPYWPFVSKDPTSAQGDVYSVAKLP